MSEKSLRAIPWSGRGSKYTDQEIDFVIEAMRTADPLTQGRYQDEFEAAFSNYTKANNAFAVSSGTAAVELAALISGIGPGDEVIIPAHTFAATAIPFGRYGAVIRWADIDPATLIVSSKTIEPLITERTKVIVVVHLYGLMCDMDDIMALAEDHEILVVEDAAQALGASDNKGRPAGSIGDFGCFSFHTHKNITTLGEGGMLTVRDDSVAALVPGLRHNGLRGFEKLGQQYWLPAMSTVDADIEGVWPYNFCIGEVQCAAGLVQLRRVDELNGRREMQAAKMRTALKEYDEISFQRTPGGYTNAHYCLPARYEGERATRDDLMAELAFNHKVKMSVQYCPLYRYPLFEKAGFGKADCPETDRFFDSMVSFPFYPWMEDIDFDHLIEVTKKSLDVLRGSNSQAMKRVK